MRRTIYWILLCLVLLAALAFVGCPPPPTPTLRVYNWNDYMTPEVLREFEKEHDVKVVHDIFSSNDELYAKVRHGNSGYDVVVPSDYMVAYADSRREAGTAAGGSHAEPRKRPPGVPQSRV